jgi:hypothetical protein
MTLTPKLNTINLGRNLLNGTLPETLWRMKSTLNFLSIYANNEMTGTFSESICNMTATTGFYLGATKFSGPLPDCLGEMTNLQKLDVSDSLFTGPIPSSIANLVNLQELYLNDVTGSSMWTGELPKKFGKLKMLETFFLATSTIRGPLPEINFFLTYCKLEPPASGICRTTDWPPAGGMTHVIHLIHTRVLRFRGADSAMS